MARVRRPLVLNGGSMSIFIWVLAEEASVTTESVILANTGCSKPALTDVLVGNGEAVTLWKPFNTIQIKLGIPHLDWHLPFKNMCIMWPLTRVIDAKLQSALSLTDKWCPPPPKKKKPN